ncbi:MAG TPA: hypothetical protein VD886_08510 [Herpetosiphonaceae bacterium]|nr:hypothetical protein [Herpetosiphonaceae bacterium]
MPAFERVEVMRGIQRDPAFQFGPLPGVRLGDVVAYEMELPARFEPWPGRTRLERIFVLLDVGVSFTQPCWFRETRADGRVIEMDPRGRDSWYVDLVAVEQQGGRIIVRDLYIDAFVPTDGRHYRMLDLDEYADAMADGSLPPAEAIDGLRRWQRFLDRHLHADRWPPDDWTDFPPAAIRPLAELPGPLGDPVRVP